MKTNRNLIQSYMGGFILLIAASLNSPLVFSANDQPANHMAQCQLLEESNVEARVIATMLEAASKGYLYQVNASSSSIAFKVNHFPFSTVEGSFERFNGGMTLPNDDNQERQAIFVIKADSMNTGDKDLDYFLKSTAFFNTVNFPNITFVSTGFEWIDASTARLYGNLTMRDTTKPIEFEIHIKTTMNSKKLVINASTEIQRSEFGMREMSLLVSDSVTFNISLTATRVDLASNNQSASTNVVLDTNISQTHTGLNH